MSTPKKVYDHQNRDAVWQKTWEEARLFETNLDETTKEKHYLLVEFPYPSGDLHTGHWHAFAVPDIYARFLRMQGKEVLFPIGFDAFGLPAENAAIKHGVDPKEWTYKNMDRMRLQLRAMGNSFDWSKEVVTAEPNYYGWTQWLFTKLFEHGLAYRKAARVKWCEHDKTVLANEQVKDGACERCGTPVVEKELTQWFFKITDYAERLLSDLETLPYPEEIKEAQRQWIGKSEGARLTFKVQTDGEEEQSVEVFTTRPDTLFGVTFLALAPEHSLVEDIVSGGFPGVTNVSALKAYLVKAGAKTERERLDTKAKTGVKVEGLSVLHPITGMEIPVFVADYVLGSYGSGAVMGVPAHDERDYAFAKKYKLPTIAVIESSSKIPYEGDGVLINSGDFTGRNNKEAVNDIVNQASGKKHTQYRLRDWLISRQRYWGCPIPIVYDPEGKPHIVPREHLPWLLPEDVDFTPTGEAPLASSKELRERTERIFGKGWRPEVDTLDTFVDSSWYFLRYLSPCGEESFSASSRMKKWLPVDRYSGGSEHTTMHLLYARFFYKALYDLALVPTTEPFKERMNRGLIMGPDGQKMSKSKGNVINPDQFVKDYGADTVKMYLAFIGPYAEPGQYPWNMHSITGIRRYLDRVFALHERLLGGEAEPETKKILAETIEKVTRDIPLFKFHTALAALMTLLNHLEKLAGVPREVYETYLSLLAPFAPHTTEELWHLLGKDTLLTGSAWPTPEEGMLEEESTVPIAVQVNGKLRATLTLSPSTPEEIATKCALAHEAIQKFLEGKEPSRVVYVPGKIINIVIT